MSNVVYQLHPENAAYAGKASMVRDLSWLFLWVEKRERPDQQMMIGMVNFLQSMKQEQGELEERNSALSQTDTFGVMRLFVAARIELIEEVIKDLIDAKKGNALSQFVTGWNRVLAEKVEQAFLKAEPGVQKHPEGHNTWLIECIADHDIERAQDDIFALGMSQTGLALVEKPGRASIQ